MGAPRTILLVITGLFLAGAVASLFDPVSATSVGGGPSWPCGSVVRPVVGPEEGLARATPESGRMSFLLDHAACADRRDRQLANAIRFLLAAAPFGLTVVLLNRRPGVATDDQAYARQP